RYGRPDLRIAIPDRRPAVPDAEDHPRAAGVGAPPRKAEGAEGLPHSGKGRANPAARQDGLHHPVPATGRGFAAVGRSIGRARATSIVYTTWLICPRLGRSRAVQPCPAIGPDRACPTGRPSRGRSILPGKRPKQAIGQVALVHSVVLSPSALQ